MNNPPSAQARLKLPHQVIVRAPGLLPMLYKVSELAGDLGISDRQLRDRLRLGAPHQVDERGNIWINGEEFRQWVQACKKPQKEKLADHEVLGMRCNQAVALVNPHQVPIQGKLYHLRGQCPDCGCSINRGARYD